MKMEGKGCGVNVRVKEEGRRGHVGQVIGRGMLTSAQTPAHSSYPAIASTSVFLLIYSLDTSRTGCADREGGRQGGVKVDR